MKHIQQSALKSKGQELVEFAIVVPLLVLIVLGVLDLGRGFHAAITIENAARVGARYAARNPGDFGDAIQAACDEAQFSGLTLNCGNISVTGSASGDPAIVTITYNFDLLFLGVFQNTWFPMLPMLPDPIVIIRSAEMLIP